MRKIISIILLAIILSYSPVYALWKFNPFTNKMDYYEQNTGPEGTSYTLYTQWDAGTNYSQYATMHYGTAGSGCVVSCINAAGCSTSHVPSCSADDTYWYRFGYDGIQGPTGATGSAGATGPTGPQGEPGAGINATVTHHTTSGTITCDGKPHDNSGASGDIVLKVNTITKDCTLQIRQIANHKIYVQPFLETDEIVGATSGAGKGLYSNAVGSLLYFRSYLDGKLYVEGGEYSWTENTPDYVLPTLTSATISGADGLGLTLAFSEALTQGSAYSNAHWDVDCVSAGDNIGVTSISGNGTNSHVYTLASAIEGTDTCNIDFTGTASSEQDANLNDLAAIVSGAVTNNSTYYACDQCTGTLLFSWHAENADVTSGTPCGCSSGDTIGTASSGATIDAVVYWDGTHSVSIPTASDYYTFDAASILSSTAGTFVTKFRVHTWAAGNNLLYANIDANNYLVIRLIGTDEIDTKWDGNSTAVQITTTDANISLDTWYTATVKWTTADVNPNLWMQICDTDNANCATAISSNTNLTAWVGTLSYIRFGDYSGAGGVLNLDYIKIYNSTTP